MNTSVNMFDRTDSSIPRDDGVQKQVPLCVSVIIDTTGSMNSSIHSAQAQIKSIFDKLDSIRQDHNMEDGSVVGQVIEYKDYNDRNMINNRCSITSDFSELERRLKSFRACGGSADPWCCNYCEDMHYGVECALNNMEKAPYKDYCHLMLVVGDAACHGDCEKICSTTCKGKIHPFFDIPIESVWSRNYFPRMKAFNDLEIIFIPIDGDGIRATYNRFREDGLNVSIESITNGIDLGSVIDSITQEYYNNLLSITKSE